MLERELRRSTRKTHRGRTRVWGMYMRDGATAATLDAQLLQLLLYDPLLDCIPCDLANP